MADRVEYTKAKPEHGLAATAYTAWLETQCIGRVEQLDDGEGPRYWLAWEHRQGLAVGGDSGHPIPFATRTEAGDKLLALYRTRRPRAQLRVENLLPNRAGQAELERRRWQRIERAAREVDRRWDELMRDDEQPGQFDAVVDAIGKLRKALDPERTVEAMVGPHG
jgi:hypothetical protein